MSETETKILKRKKQKKKKFERKDRVENKKCKTSRIYRLEKKKIFSWPFCYLDITSKVTGNTNKKEHTNKISYKCNAQFFLNF